MSTCCDATDRQTRLNEATTKTCRFSRLDGAPSGSTPPWRPATSRTPSRIRWPTRSALPKPPWAQQPKDRAGSGPGRWPYRRTSKQPRQKPHKPSWRGPHRALTSSVWPRCVAGALCLPAHAHRPMPIRISNGPRHGHSTNSKPFSRQIHGTPRYRQARTWVCSSPPSPSSHRSVTKSVSVLPTQWLVG